MLNVAHRAERRRDERRREADYLLLTTNQVHCYLVTERHSTGTDRHRHRHRQAGKQAAHGDEGRLGSVCTSSKFRPAQRIACRQPRAPWRLAPMRVWPPGRKSARGFECGAHGSKDGFRSPLHAIAGGSPALHIAAARSPAASTNQCQAYLPSRPSTRGAPAGSSSAWPASGAALHLLESQTL